MVLLILRQTSDFFKKLQNKKHVFSHGPTFLIIILNIKFDKSHTSPFWTFLRVFRKKAATKKPSEAKYLRRGVKMTYKSKNAQVMLKDLCMKHGESFEKRNKSETCSSFNIDLRNGLCASKSFNMILFY